MPEQVIAPPLPEETKEKPPQKVKFVVDKDAFDTETFKSLDATAKKINQLAELTGILYYWAGQASQDKPQQEGPALKAWVEKTDDSYKKWNDIRTKLSAEFELEQVGSDQLTALDKEIAELKPQLGIIDESDTMEVKIGNDSQVVELETRLTILGTILHDIRSPGTNIVGGAAMVKELGLDIDALGILTRGVEKCHNNARYCLRLLENPFPRQRISSDYFPKLIADELVNQKIKLIDLAGGKGYDSKKTVVWSEEWAKSLVHNLIQNVLKAYASVSEDKMSPEMFLKTDVVTEKGTQYLCYTVEDWGPGFPVGFTGFLPGKTWWGNPEVRKVSTGKGMYADLIALRYYGGDVRIDNAVGAKVQILIPIANPDALGADVMYSSSVPDPKSKYDLSKKT